MKNKQEIFANNRSSHALGYFSLLRTANWIEVRIKEALKPLGITHAQLNVLSLLAHRYPQSMSAGAIGKGVIVASPDITRLIDRLVKKELVHREACAENRRQMDITITDKGLELFYEAHESARSATEDFFKEKITEEQARQLTETLVLIRK